MNATEAADWMQQQITMDGCIYHDYVVDYLVKANAEDLLRENNDGNLVVGRAILDAFRKFNESSVVWVKPDRYWRHRIAEDEPGRDARG